MKLHFYIKKSKVRLYIFCKIIKTKTLSRYVSIKEAFKLTALVVFVGILNCFYIDQHGVVYVGYISLYFLTDDYYLF